MLCQASNAKIGLPRWHSGKESASAGDARDEGLISERKIPWRRKWQPAPVFLPGKFHRQRSLAGYSPWGRIELDMTKLLSAYILQEYFLILFKDFSNQKNMNTIVLNSKYGKEDETSHKCILWNKNYRVLSIKESFWNKKFTKASLKLLTKRWYYLTIQEPKGNIWSWLISISSVVFRLLESEKAFVHSWKISHEKFMRYLKMTHCFFLKAAF